MSSRSENSKVDGAASYPTGASCSVGVMIVVMGVSGSGKTTLGAGLAKALSMPFIDADDLHSEANKAKMTRGEPLTDADRAPWLVHVRTTAVEAVECNGRGVVVACSALKASYRQVLRGECANLNPDGWSGGDACGEAIITARDENSDRRQAVVEEGRGGLEGRLGTDEGRMVGVSMARPARRAPPTRTVFVHPVGSRSVLMERMMSREGHFMKATMLESQIEILENPRSRGEMGIVEIRLEARAEEQVGAAVEGVREELPYM